MATANDPSTILSAALNLPEEQRADLADKLLLSLAGGKDPDYDRLLREELERRWVAYERGEVAAVDWRTALDQIEAELDARGPA